MNPCTKALVEAYEDDKRETLNSLLRVTTPFPKREIKEELAVKIVSCVCFPLKCLEGLTMIVGGSICCLNPCTICKIETEHQGTEVTVKKIYPDIRKPNLPCYYEDQYISEGTVQNTKGTNLSCSLNSRPEGEQKHILATSSLTGYDCLSSGIGKVVNTLASMLCCPITWVSGAWLCCTEP